MRKRIFQIKLFSLILLLCSAAAFSQNEQPFSINESPLPAPTGFVNDYANVIDADTKQRLETRLQALKQNTNPPVEIAVAVVRTTGDRPIFDYSLAVARGWGIGTKNDDNPSALLFVAIDDRKYFTQVSRDLEDELPDGLVGSLQRQHLVPEFRKGNYSKGISDTIEAYVRAIEQKQSGQPVTTGENEQKEENRGAQRGGGCNFMVCLIILFILMIIIFSRGSGGRGGGGNRRGGGGFGGGGGALPWIIGSIVASELSKGGRSSSGGWGGSSGWGGGSSGGGWGGFGGGGDFGGGGAGGDW
ncbi:MAG TPA: TPM domain-containing protein [Pyrinomonadaceae bacterium]|nr:TPM domain-containing protein [Pyrinomonadaceae bacterium]